MEDDTFKSGTPSGIGGIGSFLTNANPARLRHVEKSISDFRPALSAASFYRSKRSSSGFFGRSRKSMRSQRQQGLFPKGYHQVNLSGIDNERPLADSVYTFMIETTVP